MEEEAQLKQQLWDDAAFKERVKAAAERKGITVQQALAEVEVSRHYLEKQADGRSTNTVLNLARVLGVPATELLS
jgi:hypothetical protein